MNCLLQAIWGFESLRPELLEFCSKPEIHENKVPHTFVGFISDEEEMMCTVVREFKQFFLRANEVT